MDGHAAVQLPAQTVADHGTRILDAAQRCFVRSGFHRATMLEVAAEAGMSAGNIYRYFPSKNAIIAGLCARDRADLARAFEELGRAPDAIATFLTIVARYLVDEPREKAIFVIDLWAETTRDPVIAGINHDFEAELRGWIGSFINRLVATGQAHEQLDVLALVECLLCMGDGVIAHRAREPNFDPAPHMNHMHTVLELACSGQMPSLLRTRADV